MSLFIVLARRVATRGQLLGADDLQRRPLLMLGRADGPAAEENTRTLL